MAPTRRDLFKYSLGAALASALPGNLAAARDTTNMPLVVDLVGPMAFKKDKDHGLIYVWMPKLPSKKHEAGMGTSVTSLLLPAGDYAISGPTPYAGDPPTYGTGGCSVYSTSANDYSAKNRFIQLTLPMPKDIVALDPVGARIYATGSTASGVYAPLAVGLRFLYEKAGVPTVDPGGTIPFDPAPDEMQLSLSIGYAPYHFHSSNHPEARYAFNELSKLFPKLDLQVDFEFGKSVENRSAATPKIRWIGLGGPLHNCKAPVILLS